MPMAGHGSNGLGNLKRGVLGSRLWLAVLRCLNAAGCNTNAGENPTHAHNAEKEGQEQGQGADDGS